MEKKLLAKIATRAKVTALGDPMIHPRLAIRVTGEIAERRNRPYWCG